jgi:hypothetical protein
MRSATVDPDPVTVGWAFNHNPGYAHNALDRDLPSETASHERQSSAANPDVTEEVPAVAVIGI